MSTHSSIKVRLDDDRMVATVVIRADCDRSEVQAELIARLARECGVVVDGDVEQRIAGLVGRFDTDAAPIEEVIAQGTPVEHGKDGAIEWLEGYDPTTRETSPQDPADSSGDPVDHYRGLRYVNVSEQTHVGNVLDPTPGLDGQDVTGEAISAKPGREIDATFDPSLAVDRQGRIVTQVAGVLQLDEGVFKVNRVLEIRENVDFSTGNVDFDGSVVVRGGVRDNFAIKAAEDLTVDELVEAADLVCGRNLYIRQGMSAKAEKNRGQLVVEGSADVGYLLNVRGRIRKTLSFRRELIDCELIVGGDLAGDGGSIIGGRTIITGVARVGTIGSLGGTATTVVLGSLPFMGLQLQRLAAMERELKLKLARDEDSLASQKEYKANLSAAEMERVTELSSLVSDDQAKLLVFKAKRAEMQREMFERQTVDLTVHKAVHPGVLLRLGSVEATFDQTVRGPLHITWDRHRNPVVRTGNGQPRALGEIARCLDKVA